MRLVWPCGFQAAMETGGMMFSDVVWIAIEKIKLTQMYLSKKKIADVLTWFDTSLNNFDPVPAHDFLRNGQLYLTDGHTRTFVAWQKGVKKIPVIYDRDDIVMCEMGQILYKHDIAWCARFGLNHISDLEGKILTEEDYERLWITRCNHMHILEEATFKGHVDKDKLFTRKYTLEQQGIYVYGLSKDYQSLYCENITGALFCVNSEL